jgi:conjugal transfer pilus assembly protein TraD
MVSSRFARLVRRAGQGSQLWLGWGFDWDGGHAQLLQNLVRTGPERIVGACAGSLGAHWIHGLGRRERDVHLPLTHTAGHLLVVGTTGSGMTRLFDFLVTQAVLRGEVVVIIDPKGGLVQKQWFSGNTGKRKPASFS